MTSGTANSIIAAYNVENIRIINNTFTGVSNPISFGQACSYVTIMGNTITSASTAIDVSSVSTGVSLVVHSNIFSGVYTGVNIWNYDSVWVAWNSFTNLLGSYPYGINIQNSVPVVAEVEYNTFVGSGAGYGIFGTGQDLTFVVNNNQFNNLNFAMDCVYSGATVFDNTFISAPLYFGSDSSLSNNIFTNISGTAVTTTSGALIADGNIFTNTRGISSQDASTVIFTNNVLRSSIKSGIFITRSSTSTTILFKNNLIENIDQSNQVVYLSGGDMEVVNNTVRDITKNNCDTGGVILFTISNAGSVLYSNSITNNFF